MDDGLTVTQGAAGLSLSNHSPASHLTRGEIEQLHTIRVPRSQQLVVSGVDMYRRQFLEVLELVDYPPRWLFAYVGWDGMNGVGRRQKTKQW